eukprot:CAMPEP_0194352416 /NCGR_PEP_ID=MMETSP0174-20130528/815_1 /TAXON_ID=216777 /ORGANISM="Proboscia alata, Strain PI-D3" /LENGTH=228 /DNA_ID=CAMNT_0039120449 /DNA_START=56 /DNA_END=742 /DNA_ORIENTATION=+
MNKRLDMLSIFISVLAVITNCAATATVSQDSLEKHKILSKSAGQYLRSPLQNEIPVFDFLDGHILNPYDDWDELLLEIEESRHLQDETCRMESEPDTQSFKAFSIQINEMPENFKCVGTCDEESNEYPSNGDFITFDDEVLRRGQVIGRFSGVCYYLVIGRQCITSIQIKKAGFEGDLIVQGVLPREQPEDCTKLAITGGTGYFMGSIGTVTIDTSDTMYVTIYQRYG